MSARESREHTTLPLHQAAEYLLEECRMVLPGIQALFGFQLVAVFSARFGDELTRGEQRAHLVAIALVAVAVVLIMTPAAYHRQKGARSLTAGFVDLSTRLLLCSMVPLACGIVLDFYLIARVVLLTRAGAAGAAAALAVVFLLWFALPRSRALERALAGPGDARPRSGR
jgi:hypothetical protein